MALLHIGLLFCGDFPSGSSWLLTVSSAVTSAGLALIAYAWNGNSSMSENRPSSCAQALTCLGEAAAGAISSTVACHYV